MVIIQNYELVNKSDDDFFYVKSNEIINCPCCEEKLKVIGSRKRGVIEHDGNKRSLIVRRLRCIKCGRIHHELPDVLVPYKRYSSDTVENILSSHDIKSSDIPCEISTAIRIKIWFFILCKYFESTLMALSFLYENNSDLCKEISNLIPCLKPRAGFTGWLKKLVRYIVNSGRWRHTRSA